MVKIKKEPPKILHERLKKFISDNHNLPEQYWKLCYKSYTAGFNKPFDKFRACLIDALNAAGGAGKLDYRAETVKKISERVMKTECFGCNGERKPSFNEFMDCFGAKDIAELFKKIQGDDFRNKKAAMFIKNLVLFSEGEIFINIDKKEIQKHLFVPLDAVLRRYLKINYLDDVQNLAKNTWDKNPSYLDDLWFWGHFSRKHKPNYSMIITDRIMTADFINKNDLLKKLKKFNSIVKSLRGKIIKGN